MTGKKLARQTSNWGNHRRGRRHVRAHVRRAAERSFLLHMAFIVFGILLICFLGSLA